jgi:hypothetical protein|tara:strand:+ start:1330 stop:1827 length:498 start_codon:yes stop_codon:yes gene_type:complete
MWAIIKVDNKSLNLLKNDFFSKLGKEVRFYIPKIQLKKFFKNKIQLKEKYLLGDYLLCHHKDFEKKSVLTSLKYCKGLKYFLTDLLSSQKEIIKFIDKCRSCEDENGFIKSSFFDFKNKKNFEFISGPFSKIIFSKLEENKTSIEALMGGYRVTVSKKENLFRPV